MMDFDRKDFIAQRIAQNGGMYQQLMMMQQNMLMMAAELDQLKGTNMAQQMAAGMGGGAPMAAVVPNAQSDAALGGEAPNGESSTTKKARQRVAEANDPT
jgi:hypothetical protein